MYGGINMVFFNEDTEQAKEYLNEIYDTLIQAKLELEEEEDD